MNCLPSGLRGLCGPSAPPPSPGCWARGGSVGRRAVSSEGRVGAPEAPEFYRALGLQGLWWRAGAKNGKLVAALASYQVVKGAVALRCAHPNPATLQVIGLFCVLRVYVRVSVPECGTPSLRRLRWAVKESALPRDPAELWRLLRLQLRSKLPLCTSGLASPEAGRARRRCGSRVWAVPVVALGQEVTPAPSPARDSRRPNFRGTLVPGP